MQARVTMFEIDTLRISISDALDLFRERILPRLREHLGCEGEVILASPEGKGLLLTFWATAEAADAGVASGFYDEQVAEFTMFLRQPPGREHYDVIFQELSQAFAPLASESTKG